MMTTMMLFRIMIVVAFVVIMLVVMMVSVGRTGRKRVGEALPTLRALGHFVVGKQTRIELGLQGVAIHLERHECERLPTIAEGLFPFLSSAFRHFGLASASIASSPPGAG
jgi:hypothetical protein